MMAFNDPPPYPSDCDDRIENAPTCLFCFVNPKTAKCTIELEDDTAQRPCGTSGGGGKLQLDPAGALIHTNTRDLYGVRGDFGAQSGTLGLTRYYLSLLHWTVDPSYPQPIAAGDFCAGWLCRVIIEHAGAGWQVLCTEVRRTSTQISGQFRRRNMPSIQELNQIVLVHCVFDSNVAFDNCWTLNDQLCFTSGPIGDGGSFWEHLDEFSFKLSAMRRLWVDFDMRISTDLDTFPRNEPDCVNIANDALKEVGNYVDHLEPSDRDQRTNYDSYNLNRWKAQKLFDTCGTNIVRKGGTAAGEPWTVFVKPYGYDCAIPADLVLHSINMDMFLSVEASAEFINTPALLQSRPLAKFECRIELGVKMRDGWQDIDCPVEFFDPGNPCDIQLADPKKFVVLAADGCTHVPLQVFWRGLVGPSPYATKESEFFGNFAQLGCCTSLFLLDGLVIPGEVNRLTEPGGSQLFTGDLVIFTQFPAEEVCL